MSTLKHKLEILSLIAKNLNKEKITWAVGGSTLLYLKNISKTFDDIDIEVTEDGVSKVKQILLNLGQLQTQDLNKNFKTKYFYEFKIENVDVDVMAGLSIINNEIEYYFPLNKEDISDYIIINNETIPLQSVLKWKQYYKLMNRHDKVKMIEEKI